MADISKITMPNGTTYDIKDTVARNLIAGGITFVVSWDGISTPVPSEIPLGVKVKHNGATYTGTMPASTAQPGAFYLVASDIGDSGPDYYDEYVAAQVDSTTKAWEKLGGKTLNLEGLQVTYTPKGSVHVAVEKSTAGGLTVSPAATGTATYTPEGTVTVTPTKNTAGSLTVSPAATGAATYTPEGSVALADSGATEDKTVVVSGGSGTATYTPAGTVTQPTFSGQAATISVSKTYKPTGTVATNTTANKTATVSPAASGDATYTPAGSVSVTLSNPQMASTGSYTPAGGITLTPPSSVIANLTDVMVTTPATGKNYTPSGSVSRPAITVTKSGTGGTTDVIHNPTSKTVQTGMTTVAPPAPGGNPDPVAIVYWEYNSAQETLVFRQIKPVTGDSITTSNVTVKTGDATYTAALDSDPQFTGNGVRLQYYEIDLTDSRNLPAAEFNGTAANITVNGTPNVSVSAKSFSGTPVRLVTGNIPVPDTYTFAGDSTTITSTGSYTPAGTVSQPTFNGTGTRLTGSYTVPKAWKFTGTGKRLKVDGTDVVVGIASTNFAGKGKRLKLDDNVVTGVGTTAGFIGTQETVPVTSSDANAGSH